MTLPTTYTPGQAGHLAVHTELAVDVNGLLADIVNKENTGVATAAIAAHVAATDPHSAAAYGIMVGGGRRIFVQSATPTGAVDGDVWIDTT